MQNFEKSQVPVSYGLQEPDCCRGDKCKAPNCHVACCLTLKEIIDRTYAVERTINLEVQNASKCSGTKEEI